MKLKIPYHSLSTNRSKLAESNPICGDPMQWFDTEYFRNESLYSTTFDFFINWSNNTFQPIAWVKRVIYSGFTIEPNEIMDSIIKCDGKDKFETVKNFCYKNDINLSYILIPEILTDAWIDNNNKVILFDVKKFEENNGANPVSPMSVKELIGLIHSYKVDYKSVRMDSEGLKLSTTSLEYFLSMWNNKIGYKGDAIYPGDADIILFDEDYCPKAIIEIKKHSIGSVKRYASTIEEENISLYVKGDKLKYQSLDILQRHWNCDFYMLFYPTTSETSIKIQKVSELKALTSKVLPLPNVHSPVALQNFQSQFVDFMNAKMIIANTTSKNQKVYHTNPHCKYIPHDKTKIIPFESEQQAIENNYHLCTACSKE